ncbi:MAG: 3-deoxy-7-phosphoheptulonate synthase [Planctomycetaceae bacterium]|nr:3-deoxy-7-phosphoheptulonate synthase [Planctomycetaceae bacterium]
MIIVMKQGTSREAAEKIAARVAELELKPHIIYGEERNVIAVVGDDRRKDRTAFETCEGVDQVMPILAEYKIASKETKSEPTIVQALDLKIGGGHLGIIAGPCSVESEEQIMETARVVKRSGAKGFRGGAFKPRTSPYSFQGMKEEGLKILAAAREETGLAIVTEVMTPHHVDLVASYADVLQIGARNMQNYQLLEAVGGCDKPTLLKRGASATMDEFLLAAEYILDRGNQQVALCERGIRTFETHTRFTLPLASVTYLQSKTHLPIVIDPSHGTGHAYLVPPMCSAAVAIKADGLIVEIHPDPPNAMSDGAQSLTLDVFEETMKQCRVIADAVGLKM